MTRSHVAGGIANAISDPIRRTGIRAFRSTAIATVIRTGSHVADAVAIAVAKPAIRAAGSAFTCRPAVAVVVPAIGNVAGGIAGTVADLGLYVAAWCALGAAPAVTVIEVARLDVANRIADAITLHIGFA